ncbi:MAG: choice-of-anchor L domain-containing protein [Fibrobacterales bacterium]
MKLKTLVETLLIAITLAVSNLCALDITGGATEQELWDQLHTGADSSVQMINVTVNAHDSGIGLFSGFPQLASAQLKDGVVIANDWLENHDDRLTYNDLWFNHGEDLRVFDYIPLYDTASHGYIRKQSSHDVSQLSLEFNIPSDSQYVSFDFVFTTHSPHWTLGPDEGINDVFIALLDNNNIAYHPNGNVIAVHNDIFNRSYEHYFPFFPGVTSVIRISQPITQGNHTLELIISDIGNYIDGSFAFISNLHFGDPSYEGQRLPQQEFTLDNGEVGGTSVGLLKNIDPVVQSTSLDNSGIDSAFTLTGSSLTISPGHIVEYKSQDSYSYDVYLTYDHFIDTIPVVITVTQPALSSSDAILSSSALQSSSDSFVSSSDGLSVSSSGNSSNNSSGVLSSSLQVLGMPSSYENLPSVISPDPYSNESSFYDSDEPYSDGSDPFLSSSSEFNESSTETKKPAVKTLGIVGLRTYDYAHLNGEYYLNDDFIVSLHPRVTAHDDILVTYGAEPLGVAFTLDLCSSDISELPDTPNDYWVTLQVYSNLGTLVHTFESPVPFTVDQSTTQNTCRQYNQSVFIQWNGKDFHNRMVGSGVYIVKGHLSGTNVDYSFLERVGVLR